MLLHLASHFLLLELGSKPGAELLGRVDVQ